nr:hypothetical protein [uncultured Carboxylicivirga sp.]
MNRQILFFFILLIFAIISGTGLLMYIFPFRLGITITHVVFATLFLVFILFHLINNFKTIIQYLSKGKRSILYFLISITVITPILIASYTQAPPLVKLYQLGSFFKNQGITNSSQVNYQIIDFTQKQEEPNIILELKRGESFQYPLFAIWIESLEGEYIQTLYISRSIATSEFGRASVNKSIIRRPEALPYWSHKRGEIAGDGLYIPKELPADLDGVSGATPSHNFIFKTNYLFDNNNSYRILLEVNQSFDWNNYYSKKKFPEDKIYSGSGQVGQPSLIYSCQISSKELKSDINPKIMTLIGHGHHSGKNGELYSDLSNITTARHITDRIILTIKK